MTDAAVATVRSRKALGTSNASYEPLHPSHILSVSDTEMLRLRKVMRLGWISNQSGGRAELPERGEIIQAVKREIGLVFVAVVEQGRSAHTIGVRHTAALAPFRIRPRVAAQEPSFQVIVRTHAVVRSPVANHCAKTCCSEPCRLREYVAAEHGTVRPTVDCETVGKRDLPRDHGIYPTQDVSKVTAPQIELIATHESVIVVAAATNHCRQLCVAEACVYLVLKGETV